jgi:predicted HAD superfamily hydrolase
MWVDRIITAHYYDSIFNTIAIIVPNWKFNNNKLSNFYVCNENMPFFSFLNGCFMICHEVMMSLSRGGGKDVKEST